MSPPSYATACTPSSYFKLPPLPLASPPDHQSGIRQLRPSHGVDSLSPPRELPSSFQSQPRSTYHDSRSMPPPAFVPDHSRKRKAATTAPYPSTSPSPTPEADDEDVDYHPTQNKRPAKASGSKGHKGGMSREQLRKANHSLIERRRREKINSALAELREMVPGLSGESKGGEFKLEVLERTVSYMRTLTGQIEELEARLSSQTGVEKEASSRLPSHASSEGTTKSSRVEQSTSSAKTLPSPSLSPDPNETEPEGNLPPPYTLASRSPTIASLIHAANDTKKSPPRRSSTSGTASGTSSSANLYLPFPTPSPTSPFMSYHTSMSHVGSSGSGPPSIEPSPFIAPLQNMSLFGGVLNLDEKENRSNEANSIGQHGNAQNQNGNGNGRGKNEKVMPAEEAANLLLAFSSPDVMRPTIGTGSGMTPKMIPVTQDYVDGQRERRGTCGSDEFVLDGGVRSASEVESGQGNREVVIVGKTAKDILKMK